MRIITLEALQEWNRTHEAPVPRQDKPVVLEWFLDYFAGLCIEHDKETSRLAFDTIVEFAEKCENFSRAKALHTVCFNLGWWFDRNNHSLRLLSAMIPEYDSIIEAGWQ